MKVITSSAPYFREATLLLLNQFQTKVSAAYKACRGLGNKKPILAVPERVIICVHLKLSALLLGFMSFYPNDCSVGSYASKFHPDRGNSSLIYPGISSLPGRLFLGLSEEVCPEAQWFAESLSLKESKIYEFHGRPQPHVSIVKCICNLP